MAASAVAPVVPDASVISTDTGVRSSITAFQFAWDMLYCSTFPNTTLRDLQTHLITNAETSEGVSSCVRIWSELAIDFLQREFLRPGKQNKNQADSILKFITTTDNSVKETREWLAHNESERELLEVSDCQNLLERCSKLQLLTEKRAAYLKETREQQIRTAPIHVAQFLSPEDMWPSSWYHSYFSPKPMLSNAHVQYIELDCELVVSRLRQTDGQITSATESCTPRASTLLAVVTELLHNSHSHGLCSLSALDLLKSRRPIPIKFSDADSSVRTRTIDSALSEMNMKLFPHHHESVDWMASLERLAWTDQPLLMLPPTDHQLRQDNSNEFVSNLYCHVDTLGHVQRIDGIPPSERPLRVRGGFLNDDTGVGKTISMFGLVQVQSAWDMARAKRNDPVHPRYIMSDSDVFPRRRIAATMFIDPNQTTMQHYRAAAAVFPKDIILILSTKEQYMSVTYDQMCQAKIVIVSREFFGNNQYAQSTSFLKAQLKKGWVRGTVRQQASSSKRQKTSHGDSNSTSTSGSRALTEEHVSTTTVMSECEVGKSHRGRPSAYNDDDIRFQRFSFDEFIFARVIVDEASELFDGKRDTYARKIRQLQRDFTWYVSATFPRTPSNMQGMMQLLQVSVGDEMVCDMESAYARNSKSWQSNSIADGQQRSSIYYTAFGSTLMRVVDRYLRIRRTKQDIRKSDPNGQYFQPLSKHIVIAPRGPMEAMLRYDFTDGDIRSHFMNEMFARLSSITDAVTHLGNEAAGAISPSYVAIAQHHLDIACSYLRVFREEMGINAWSDCDGKWFVYTPGLWMCQCTWTRKWNNLGRPGDCLLHPLETDGQPGSVKITLASDGSAWTLSWRDHSYASRTWMRDNSILPLALVEQRAHCDSVLSCAYRVHVEAMQTRLAQTHDMVSLFKTSDESELKLIREQGARNATMVFIIRQILEASTDHRLLVFTTCSKRLESFRILLQEILPQYPMLRGGRDIRSKTRALTDFNADNLNATVNDNSRDDSSPEEILPRILCFTKDQGASGANIITATHLLLLDTESRATAVGRAQAELNENQILGRVDRITQTKRVQVIRILLDDPVKLKEFAESI